MTARADAGIDIGNLTVKVATADEVTTTSAPAGGPVAAVRAALTQVGAQGGNVCVAVPDAWLSGEASGAATLEDVRHQCDVPARTRPLGWVGQLAAVSALTTSHHGPGCYLVCDIGGTGVRAGVFTTSGATVRFVATHTEAGGGWLEFDRAVRAALSPAQAASLPATWYDQVTAKEKNARATLVLAEAATGLDDALGTRLYRIAGADGPIRLTARVVIDGFASTSQRLRAAISAVAGDVRPDHLVLTGSLNWLPLAASAVATAAGFGPARAGAPDPGPIILGPESAARGALRFARGEARLEPPAGQPSVAVPVHRIRDGLLDEISVTLPWNGSFADFPGGDPTIDSTELHVLVGGRPHIARLNQIMPGPYLIGLRPTWPGPGVLVVRSATGHSGPQTVPLADLEAQ